MRSEKQVTLTTFTDPMMGLSYESEPYFRRLETHFKDRIRFRYIMSGLVRNVYDFVDPDDLKVGKEYALEKYRLKLAAIYKSEESITGMPVNMTNLQLFTPDYTSSIPLNLAYKAAQLANREKADRFLYNLRFATIVECRPTTRLEEIIVVVANSGIRVDAFLEHYNDGSARRALDNDFALRQRLGVRGLPAYLLEYEERGMLINGLACYAQFRSAIMTLTNGTIAEQPPEVSTENLRTCLSGIR